jgi:transcriptional regulator with XRE-family HTH domain
MPISLSQRLATTVAEARTRRGLTVSELSTLSGVSRTMIQRIEEGGVQPTAALLARLSGALELTLSQLIARAEGRGERLVREADQEMWTDPSTGYRRRSVSPADHGPLELVEVELPAHTEVRMPADTYTFISQQIWILAGHLRFVEGEVSHDLHRGDCLQLGEPTHCVFMNPSARPCRYLVAIAKRHG